MSVLFITHDFGVVAEIADRVTVMRHGRIVEQGAPERLLSDPADGYTRALIDAIEATGTDPADVPESYWRMSQNRLSSGMACRVYGVAEQPEQVRR